MNEDEKPSTDSLKYREALALLDLKRPDGSRDLLYLEAEEIPPGVSEAFLQGVAWLRTELEAHRHPTEADAQQALHRWWDASPLGAAVATPPIVAKAPTEEQVREWRSARQYAKSMNFGGHWIGQGPAKVLQSPTRHVVSMQTVDNLEVGAPVNLITGSGYGVVRRHTGPADRWLLGHVVRANYRPEGALRDSVDVMLDGNSMEIGMVVHRAIERLHRDGVIDHKLTQIMSGAVSKGPPSYPVTTEHAPSWGENVLSREPVAAAVRALALAQPLDQAAIRMAAVNSYRCTGKSCPERPPVITSQAEGVPKCYTCGTPMKAIL